MGLFTLGNEYAEKQANGLVDDRSTEEAVASLLQMPMTPSQKYRAEQGDSKVMGKMFLDSMTGGVFRNLIFPDYTSDASQYKSDLELYNKQRELEVEGNYVDPHNEAIARDMEDPNSPNYNPFLANVVRQSGPEKLDLNNTTLSKGQKLVGFGGNTVAEGNPADDSTTAERNLAARNELYAREPADKTSAEWAAWDQERKFFESSVRANQVVKDTVFSGSGRGVVGDPETYYENTERQSAAAQRGQQDVQTAATMFADAKGGAEEAYRAMEEYDFSLQNANEVLTGLQENRYQTGMARSLMLDYLGLGGVSDGELLAMGTDEAIKKVQGFNGHTTDFEYGQAFNAAFARLKNNKDVNIGVMQDVIKGLENARQNAESAYTSNVYDASNAARATVEKRWVERLNKRNQTKYPKAPKIGFERDGLRYMGGDPTNLLNWVETE